MVRVPLPICKYERGFVGPNGMAEDEVAGEERSEAKSQPDDLPPPKSGFFGPTPTPPAPPTAPRLVRAKLASPSPACRADSRAFAGWHGRFREASSRARRPTRGRSHAASRRRGPGRRRRSSPAPLRGRSQGWLRVRQQPPSPSRQGAVCPFAMFPASALRELSAGRLFLTWVSLGADPSPARRCALLP